MPHSTTLVAALVLACGIGAALLLIWAVCKASKTGDEDQSFGPLFDADAPYFVDGWQREKNR